MNLNAESMQDLWFESCKKVSQITDPPLKSFLLRFVNRGYLLNTILSRFLQVSPDCSFCGAAPETYIHLCWSCPNVIQSIQSTCDMLDMYLDWDSEEWFCDNFLFSNFSNPIVVYITGLLKKFIL